MVRIFSNKEECPFSLVPMDPDGWCAFRCVATATEAVFGSFVGALQAYAEQYCTENEGFLNDTEHFMALWQQLDGNNTESVQDLWSCDDGDVLLPLIASFLNREVEGSVRILQVWKITEGALRKGAYVYPSEDGDFEHTIDLLSSNVIVPHYDLLHRKTGGQ